jgi:glycine/D-amino acid oxidase-like deaminating enzyme
VRNPFSLPSALDGPSPIPAYFDSFAPPAVSTKELTGHQDFDVVIVGGGYTGLSTAVHLAERGIPSVVLEAKEIGWGESSRSFGQVVPYLKHPPEHLARQLGREVAERLVDATGQGPDLVFSLIDRYRIDCSAVRKGLIFGAHSPAGLATLERRTAFWQQRGAPVDMFGARETEALIGSRYYAACSLDRRGGTINPLAYVRGLARVAIEAGATVYAQTPMTALARVGGAWHVETPGGRVRASTVVLATNAYATSRVWPGLHESLIPMRAYQRAGREEGERAPRDDLPPAPSARLGACVVRLGRDDLRPESSPAPACRGPVGGARLQRPRDRARHDDGAGHRRARRRRVGHAARLSGRALEGAAGRVAHEAPGRMPAQLLPPARCRRRHASSREGCARAAPRFSRLRTQPS